MAHGPVAAADWTSRFPGQDPGRSIQQDDHIEPWLEADLVLLAPGDEQHVRVLGGQELFDGVLPPPLVAVRQWLVPSVVGVNGLVPAGSKRLDNTGFPGPRHASQQHPLHDREPTGRRRQAAGRLLRAAGPCDGAVTLKEYAQQRQSKKRPLAVATVPFGKHKGPVAALP
jgi:hypothetical protein